MREVHQYLFEFHMNGDFKPRIFVSYSLTKSAHKKTTEKFLELLKEVFFEEGMEMVDPMQSRAGESTRICEEVEAGVYNSDAMFVIEYPPVLNTAYEAGMASALGIPTFHWLPTRMTKKEKLRIAEYLKFLGSRDGSIQLPSDLGDRRYYGIPNNIVGEPSAGAALKDRFRKCLNDLREGALSQHASLARRRFRNVTAHSIKLLRQNSGSRSLCWILSSLMGQHENHLRGGDNKHFTIDESVYLTFLDTLNDNPENSQKILAVADITSNIERFWFNGGHSHTVSQRIFRLSWKVLFSDSALDNFLDFARYLSAKYSVYVTDSDTQDAYLENRMSSISGDFFVFRPVFGYYKKDRNSSTKLEIKADERQCSLLEENFERLKTVSAQIHVKSSVAEIRREWMRMRGIGNWPTHYVGGDQRDSKYYQNYDINIRVWIPEYDVLCERVASEVINCLTWLDHGERTVSGLNGRKSVGEIGVGTGGVTQIVARWCDALNKAGCAPIARYLCVDSVKQMCDATERVYKEFNAERAFSVKWGSGFDGLKASIAKGRFDVICGSLILHYLINASEGDSWSDFFNNLREVLSDGGIAIFGGCFFSQDEVVRGRQIQWWSGCMKRNGMDDDAVDRFVSGNTEMCAMPSAEVIAKKSHGTFRASFVRVGPELSPFGVLTLKPVSAMTPSNPIT